MKKNIIAIIVTIAATLTACTANEETQDIASQPLTITTDTRALDAAADISLNVSGTTKTYVLEPDGTFEPKPTANPEGGNKIYVAPATTTLPVYAWGTVKYNLDESGNTTNNIVDMPVLHANPTTPVTWSNNDPDDPQPTAPTIALTLTPATARIKLAVKDNKGNDVTPTAATLHGIATPAGTWDTDNMPPVYNKEANSTSVALETDGTFAQAIPGTVPTNAHLLTVDGKTIIATRPYTFLPGYEYTLNVTINTEGQAEITHTTIGDFAEGKTIQVGGPDGTRLIYNQKDLEDFRTEVNAGGAGLNLNALQIADITLTGAPWTEGIGTDGYSYKGTYNGGGYTITNFKLTGTSYNGLFGNTANATLANITLINPQVTGSFYIGALAGYTFGNTTISHCRVEGGTVTGTANSIGGLIGVASGDTHITNCYASANVSGTVQIGGLVGFLSYSSRIVACHSAGSATATSIGGEVGGIAGYTEANPTIRFCYTTTTVAATGSTPKAGALVGWNLGGYTSSCYANGTVNDDPATGTNLIGTGTGTAEYIAAGTDANPYGIITSGGDLKLENTRMWSNTDKAWKLYTFKSNIWTSNLTLDITKAVKQ